MELITEMSFLSEQSPFLAYIFAVSIKCFSVLTQSMSNKYI